MNTLGGKVPSCQRSEGSPSSEYEVPPEPPTPPCFLGLTFSELSWRQPVTQTISARDLDLSASPTLPERGHSLELLGGPVWLFLLLSLPVLSCLPVSPSCSFYIQCLLSWFVIPRAVSPRSCIPYRICKYSPASLPVLGLVLKDCPGSKPRPHPTPPYPSLSGSAGG